MHDTGNFLRLRRNGTVNPQDRVVVALGCLLTIASFGLLKADYSRPPAETPAGLQYARLYLEDDFWPIEQLRPRLPAIGYATGLKVLGPVLDRDASSAYRWTDIGEAFVGLGYEQQAEYCYRQASLLAPHDPLIQYAVGDFYATEGNREAALARFSTVLTGSEGHGDGMEQNVFVNYERLGVRQHGMLDQAIPDAVNARDYLRYVMGNADTPAVRELWEWVHGKSFDDEALTIDYVDFLFRNKDLDTAEEAWRDHFAGRKDGYSRLTPVFNGGFEYAFTAGIPDWHFDAIPGVKAQRDHASQFDGDYSLRVDFSGNDNLDFHQVYQTVVVQPGTYRFEAHARTANITSDQGVEFRILSLPDRKLLAETEALTGTNDWKRLQTTVDVPRGTSQVNVQLTRRRSIRIDNQLTGTAWVDAVKLVRVP